MRRAAQARPARPLNPRARAGAAAVAAANRAAALAANSHEAANARERALFLGAPDNAPDPLSARVDPAAQRARRREGARRFGKKTLAVFMAVVLAIGLMPLPAFGDDGSVKGVSFNGNLIAGSVSTTTTVDADGNAKTETTRTKVDSEGNVVTETESDSAKLDETANARGQYLVNQATSLKSDGNIQDLAGVAKEGDLSVVPGIDAQKQKEEEAEQAEVDAAQAAFAAEDAALDVSGLDDQAFSTQRIVVALKDGASLMERDGNNVVSSGDGMYVLAYRDADAAKRAYVRYTHYDGTALAAPDSAVEAAEDGDGDESDLLKHADDAADAEGAATPEKEVPAPALEGGEQTEKALADEAEKRESEEATKPVDERKAVVALIDTAVASDVVDKWNAEHGTSATLKRVSVLNEDGNQADEGGSETHGDKMLKTILENADGANLEILSIEALDSTGYGAASTVYAALQAATAARADIVNMSFAGYAVAGNEAIKQGVEEALAANPQVALIAAAGNQAQDARYFVPAGYDGVTAVGALADNSGSDNLGSLPNLSFADRKQPSSNYGDAVDLWAPAESTSYAAAKATGALAAMGTDLATDWAGELQAALLSQQESAGEPATPDDANTVNDTQDPQTNVESENAESGEHDSPEPVLGSIAYRISTTGASAGVTAAGTTNATGSTGSGYFNVSSTLTSEGDTLRFRYLNSSGTYVNTNGNMGTGLLQKWSPSVDGTYTFTIYGAGGGGSYSVDNGGAGGLTTVTMDLTTDDVLYICAGGGGSWKQSATAVGGYGGGGDGLGYSGRSGYAGGGGGASFVILGTPLTSGTFSADNVKCATSQIIGIAGGGGGGMYDTINQTTHQTRGGVGGGLSGGYPTIRDTGTTGSSYISGPGTQSKGYSQGDGITIGITHGPGGGGGWWGAAGGDNSNEYVYTSTSSSTTGTTWSAGGGSGHVGGNGTNSATDGTVMSSTVKSGGTGTARAVSGSMRAGQGAAGGSGSNPGTPGYVDVTLTTIASVDLPTEENETATYSSPKLYSVVVPYTGLYKLELYGASGKSYSNTALANGGHTVAYVELEANTNLYLVPGGIGPDITTVGYGRGKGGFNGGGDLYEVYTTGGGGASHVATALGSDSTGLLKSYGSSDADKLKVLAVAGGGGSQGASTSGTPGAGGGVTGGDAVATSLAAKGGTQNAKGANAGNEGSDGGFGYGGSARHGGGGGGWYGGGGVGTSGNGSSQAAGGGSGHLGPVLGNNSQAEQLANTATASDATRAEYTGTYLGAQYTSYTERSDHSGNGSITVTLIKKGDYTVSFSANNGTSETRESDPAFSGGSYTIPECTFTAPAGKRFSGWKVTGSNAIVQKGDSFTVSDTATWKNDLGQAITGSNNSTVTLVAQWEKYITYYDKNGGEWCSPGWQTSTLALSETDARAIKNLNTPTGATGNEVFIGWATTPAPASGEDTRTVYKRPGEAISETQLDLYAVYSPGTTVAADSPTTTATGATITRDNSGASSPRAETRDDQAFSRHRAWCAHGAPGAGSCTTGDLVQAVDEMRLRAWETARPGGVDPAIPMHDGQSRPRAGRKAAPCMEIFGSAPAPAPAGGRGLRAMRLRRHRVTLPVRHEVSFSRGDFLFRESPRENDRSCLTGGVTPRTGWVFP